MPQASIKSITNKIEHCFLEHRGSEYCYGALLFNLYKKPSWQERTAAELNLFL